MQNHVFFKFFWILWSLLTPLMASQALADTNKDFYQKLIREVDGRKTITISVYYGFLEMIADEHTSELKSVRFEGAYDWGPDEKTKLKNFLLESCAGKDNQRCGFHVVDPRNDDILEKEVTLFGKTLTLHVRLRSVTKLPNRHSSYNDPQLRALGESWERELEESLKTDSVIMILSHSRIGGGPDPFYPEISNIGKILYHTYYFKEKRGLKVITGDYAPIGQNQIFVVGACYSHNYFYKDIRANVARQGKPDDEFLYLGTKRILNLVDFDVATKEIISGLSVGEGPQQLSTAWKNPQGTGPDTCFAFDQNWTKN